MTERSVSDLIEIIECAYGFDSDDCEICDCPEWIALKRAIDRLQAENLEWRKIVENLESQLKAP